jgi:hypothetical protein
MVRPQALFATPPVKGSADSGAFYATSNQICATPLRDATPARELSTRSARARRWLG